MWEADLVNTLVKTIVAGSIAVLAAEAAFAQAVGGAAPLPGAADSKAVVAGNQESQADYNRQLGAKDSKPGRRIKAVPATAADLVVGSAVRDKSGADIGMIEGVEADGIVVASAVGKVKVPTEAFGKDKKGLLLQISKADFDAAVRSANTPGG